jgi:hypothetical protein
LVDVKNLYSQQVAASVLSVVIRWNVLTSSEEEEGITLVGKMGIQ